MALCNFWCAKKSKEGKEGSRLEGEKLRSTNTYLHDKKTA